MAWSTAWQDKPLEQTEEAKLIEEAKENFKRCEEWEATFRTRYYYDYRFAHGDTHNKYQWDQDTLATRVNRPCLTVNKTQQHNKAIINDAKQNKPGVRIRPVGNEATFEGAQVFQEVVYHIEYISNAEQVYDTATSFQVNGGMGYWKITTEFENAEKGFDQEIKIKRVKDPMAVYLDPDIDEVDGSDARFGFDFEDVERKLFDKQYPDFAGQPGTSTLGQTGDMWLTKDHIRVANYYKKEEEKKKYVYYVDPTTQEEVEGLLEELKPDQKEIFKVLKARQHNLPIDLQTYRERDVLSANITCYKIAGDMVIEKKPWAGKYIPLVRVPGTEMVIDGTYDSAGNTRALINPQQMYNYNTSANVEYGALQTKSPWVTAVEAIAGFEKLWENANNVNLSYLPYNGIDEDGNQIAAPTRPAAPQASPAYVEQLKIAQNEMMMSSGQYQAQMGENENAKSGVAINARQRQGDRATYHFIDNLAIAIRYTGKILIDLIPKIYDTKRVKRIETSDGRILNVTIDPNAETGYQNVTDPNNQQMDKNRPIEEIIFNPAFGYYDIMADTGPSFATRRQEAFNALTQIAAQNKDFMNIAGDILWKVADFPEAQVLADRWRRLIPPNILGDAPNPQTEQAMHAAADKIEQQLTIIAQQTKEIADKGREFDIKERDLNLREKEVAVEQQRLDYDSETKRMVALGNSGPAITPEQVQPVIRQLLQGMLKEGEFEGDRLDSLPDVPGSRLAPDGNHYVHNHPSNPGGWSQVVPNQQDEGETPNLNHNNHAQWREGVTNG